MALGWRPPVYSLAADACRWLIESGCRFLLFLIRVFDGADWRFEGGRRGLIGRVKNDSITGISDGDC